MFSFLLFAALGAYISKRAHFFKEDGIGSMTLNYAAIAADLVALFAFLASLWTLAISTGRNARNYFDAAIAPWLSARGIDLKLPAIELPKLPATTDA